jgi:hypothetical protein
MGRQNVPGAHHYNVGGVYAQLAVEIGKDHVDYGIKRPTPNLQ